VWSGWLGRQGGKLIAAPKAYGNRRHKVIEPAPGRYVRQKA
jgi:polyhydroxyalkanoate synthase